MADKVDSIGGGLGFAAKPDKLNFKFHGQYQKVDGNNDITATQGGDGFARWIDLDDGARYLGEVALVGGDSPIARSGLFFEHTLLDENAWPHVAIGQAYTVGLENGAERPARELAELGFNTSAVHTDIMVGSPEVSIAATRCSNTSVVGFISRV